MDRFHRLPSPSFGEPALILYSLPAAAISLLLLPPLLPTVPFPESLKVDIWASRSYLYHLPLLILLRDILGHISGFRISSLFHFSLSKKWPTSMKVASHFFENIYLLIDDIIRIIILHISIDIYYASPRFISIHYYLLVILPHIISFISIRKSIFYIRYFIVLRIFYWFLTYFTKCLLLQSATTRTVPIRVIFHFE